MIDFSLLTLSDIKIAAPYFAACTNRACDNTIGGTFMWRDFFSIEYAIICGSLVFKLDYFGKEAFFMPLGGDVFSALSTIYADCEDTQHELVICTATASDIALLNREFDITATHEADWSDYLYSADKLSTMLGKKYNGQRNHMNRFRRENENYHFSELSSENAAQVVDFFQRLSENSNNSSAIFNEEKRKVFEVLENFEAYRQTGLILYSNSNIVAFSIGEIIGDTLFVHIEKADTEYAGAYQMIVSEFVSTNINKGIVYVNREEDVGDMGLRASKLSYHPVSMVEKFTVRVNSRRQ